MRLNSVAIIICFLLSFSSELVYSQTRIDSLRIKLNELSNTSPTLNDKIDLAVDGVSIGEFLRGIGSSYKLNINVDPNLNAIIYNNFNNLSVKDLLVFVCDNYKLDIKFFGPIMSFIPYVEPQKKIIAPQSKEIKLSYDKSGNLLTVDLLNDTLKNVFKKLTQVTGKNFVYAPALSYKLMNGYFQNSTLDDAIEKLSFSNEIKITKSDNDYYYVEPIEIVRDNSKGSNTNSSSKNQKPPSVNNIQIKALGSDLFSITASDASISDILNQVSEVLGIHYFLFSEPKGNISVTLDNSDFEQFLKYIFEGSDYTFNVQNGIYLIGERSQEGLRSTEIIQLQNRTVDKITDFIPSTLKQDVEMKIFPDLNSLIISGSKPAIDEIKNFIFEIDKVVPVVQIEVIIVDVRKSKILTTGIEAGLSDATKKTGGVVFPGADVTISSQSLNDLIDGINGLGILNLGKVTPSFYLTLKALETDGVLKVNSTPKLATLNGNEATMTIGNTEYYLETSNNVIGSQNPQNIITQQYKSVNADLTLTITPFVSGDDQITLDVDFSQQSFTERISNTAPPGTISREFKSSLRVKNEEMIILGGLEENKSSDSGSGTPLLARLPIIKWLFSSRTKSTNKNKLIIFIKPTVIYN